MGKCSHMASAGFVSMNDNYQAQQKQYGVAFRTAFFVRYISIWEIITSFI